MYSHCWQSDDNTNGVAHWGRANGWVIVAQVELFKKIKDYPLRGKLLKDSYEYKFDSINFVSGSFTEVKK